MCDCWVYRTYRQTLAHPILSTRKHLALSLTYDSLGLPMFQLEELVFPLTTGEFSRYWMNVKPSKLAFNRLFYRIFLSCLVPDDFFV